MRGLEVAFWGVLGKGPELKTSRSGKPWTSLNIAVVIGKADDGAEVSQWVRVAVFGDAATTICERARKGDKVYVEGNLTLDTWTAADGEKRHGLSVLAWKCEKLAQIGKNRPKRAVSGPDDTRPADKMPTDKGGRDFSDPLPF